MLDSDLLKKLDLLRLAVRKLATVRRDGDRPVRRPGPSSDFLAHAPYAAGDEFRYIDWAAYARLEELFIKQFAREEAISLELVLDTSASMAYGSPPKSALAAHLAQAFGYVALANRGRATVHSCPHPGGGETLRSQAFEGGGAPLELIRYVDALPAGSTLTLSSVLRSLRPTPGRRPFVVVLSDLWMPVETSDLRALRAKFGQTALLHLLSRDELDPPLEGKFRLTDAETGASREMYVDAETVAEYGRRLSEHLNSLQARAEDNEIAYIRLRSDTPLDKAFFITIREAGLLS